MNELRSHQLSLKFESLHFHYFLKSLLAAASICVRAIFLVQCILWITFSTFFRTKMQERLLFRMLETCKITGTHGVLTPPPYSLDWFVSMCHLLCKHLFFRKFNKFLPLIASVLFRISVEQKFICFLHYG